MNAKKTQEALCFALRLCGDVSLLTVSPKSSILHPEEANRSRIMTLVDTRLPAQPVADFCQRWCISELALFGSALRDDFRPDSDLDILVTFEPDADWGLLDHIRMERELATILGRDINLLTRRSVEQSHNWIRRQEILDSAEVVYGS